MLYQQHGFEDSATFFEKPLNRREGGGGVLW